MSISLSVIRAAVVAICGLAAAASCHAGPFAYIASGDKQFGTLDLATGAFQQIGTLPEQLGGLARGPGGILYGLDATNTLVRIDAATAAVQTAGNTGLPLVPPFQPGGASIVMAGNSSGQLFGVDATNTLYTFNPNTGQPTQIGFTGIPFPDFSTGDKIFSNSLAAIGSDLFYTYQSLYFDFATGIPGNDITPPALYRLDPNTGVATMIGPTDPVVVGSVHIGEVLYGFELDTSGGASNIVILDRTTGATSFVADLDPSLTFVYAAVAIPEPSCMALLLLGLVGLTGTVVVGRVRHHCSGIHAICKTASNVGGGQATIRAQ